MKNVIKSISITELSDKLWQKYFVLVQELNRKYYPEFFDKDKTEAAFKAYILDMHKGMQVYGRKEYLLMVDSDVIGWFNYSFYGQALGVNFDFNKEVIHQRDLELIFRAVHDELASKPKTDYVSVWEFNLRAIDVMNKIGAEVYDNCQLNRLDRTEMDLQKLKKIVEENNPGEEFNISVLNQYPDGIYKRLIPFLNQSFKDINSLSPRVTPFPDQTEEEQRGYIERMSKESIHQIVLITDKAGEIAALCSAFLTTGKLKRLRHFGGITGVAAAYRGRGLAKFAKAKMYVDLLTSGADFEFAESDTMPWNTYMYKINKELGFKLHSEGFEYRLTREFIKNFIENTID